MIRKRQIIDYKLCYRALFLLAKLPSECKNSTPLREFKTRVKNQKGGEIFPFSLCKDYLPYMDASDMMEVWNFPYSYKNFAQINNSNNDFTPFCTLYL